MPDEKGLATHEEFEAAVIGAKMRGVAEDDILDKLSVSKITLKRYLNGESTPANCYVRQSMVNRLAELKPL